MTAKQAIVKECQDCTGNKYYTTVCCSPECALSPAREFKTSLRRIRAHCTECNPSKTVVGIKDCGGDRLIGGFADGPHECNLYPFRLGNNPFKPKRTPKEPTEAQRLARERFKARIHSTRKGLISHETPSEYKGKG